MAKELLINLKRIHEKPILLDAEVTPTDLELEHPDFVFSHPVFVHASVQIIAREILVEGKIHFQLNTECARCLEPMTKEITAGSLLFSYEYQDQDFLDITPDIRDELYLNLPTRTLCSESCRGLCPVCRKNLNKERCLCPGRNNSSPFSHLAFDLKPDK
jgi:uncharacterized protein